MGFDSCQYNCLCINFGDLLFTELLILFSTENNLVCTSTFVIAWHGRKRDALQELSMFIVAGESNSYAAAKVICSTAAAGPGQCWGHCSH